MFPRTKSWHLIGWRCALALTIAYATTGPAFAQGPEAKAQLEAIFKDWQYRQGIFKSARYVLEGSTEFKDEKLPPGNPIRPYRVTLLLDLEKKRYRMESSQGFPHANGKENDPKEWEYRPRISTSAYNGKELQTLAHRKANRLENHRADDLWIARGKLGPGDTFGPELQPIFLAHGIVPTVHSRLLADKLPLTHDPDDFDIAGRQLLHDQNCLLVRTEPLPAMSPISDQFWINSQQKSAILRHIGMSGSNPWSRLDIVWKNTAYGWWPDHWSNMWSDNGRVRHIIRFRVESFEANPEITDSDFSFPVEPGMVVEIAEAPPPGKGLDPFKAAVKMYKISPSGSWDEISAKGFTTLEGKELPSEGRWGWTAWILGGAVSIMALLFYVLRRHRKMAAI